MREQIVIEIPQRIGYLITKGLIDKILIKKGAKDITIYIKEDKDFTLGYDNQPNKQIQILIK